jgi:hypothetical protein
MNAADARAAMLKTARKYRLMHLRCVFHEATLAFDRAKAELLSSASDLDSVGKEVLVESLEKRKAALDDARRELQTHRESRP